MSGTLINRFATPIYPLTSGRAGGDRTHGVSSVTDFKSVAFQPASPLPHRGGLYNV